MGWTYASAFRAVYRRLKLGTNLFYTSADLTAAREFIEDCCRWARVFQVVARDLGEAVIDDSGMTALQLRFHNGARIVAGSSNPKFFRSKGGDADADEFAFHEHPRELYKAMQPAALIWGHQLRIWSTHNGEGNFFHRLVQSALNESDVANTQDALLHRSPADLSPARLPLNRHSALSPSATKPGTAPPRQSAASGRPDIAPAGYNPVGVASPDDEPGVESPITNQRLHAHRVTLIDAVNQGLVERIRRLPDIDLTARRDFLEEIRASCPDEASWREEYLCEPSAEGSALLAYPLIAGCEAANLRLVDVEALSTGSSAEEPATAVATGRCGGPLYAGFDVGRRRDRSVLWVVEPVGDVLWTRALRVVADTQFSLQEQLLELLMHNRRVRRLSIDCTGIGAMLAERLASRFGHRVEPVHFTAPVKNDLAMPLVRLFQERLVRIPADPAVREDLHKVRRTVTAAHHIRLSAPRDTDGHADRFWALALACHAARQNSAAVMPTQARKPVGW